MFYHHSRQELWPFFPSGGCPRFHRHTRNDLETRRKIVHQDNPRLSHFLTKQAFGSFPDPQRKLIPISPQATHEKRVEDEEQKMLEEVKDLKAEHDEMEDALSQAQEKRDKCQSDLNRDQAKLDVIERKEKEWMDRKVGCC